MAIQLLDEIPEAPALGGFDQRRGNRLDVVSSDAGLLSEQLSAGADPFGTSRPAIGLDIPESTIGLSQEAGGLGLPSLAGVSRTPESSFKQEGLTNAQIQQRKGTATALGIGLQLGSVQTGNEEFFSGDTAIQVLGSAGAGFAVGGPWGAFAGGLAAGVGAFLTTQSQKRRNKEVRAKEARYQKMVKQQIAREDKFRREDRFERLENVNYNRTATKMQQQWDVYKDFTGQIMGVLNSNEKLQRRFAKEGF